MKSTQTINMRIFLRLENRIINNLRFQIIHVVKITAKEAFQIMMMIIIYNY